LVRNHIVDNKGIIYTDRLGTLFAQRWAMKSPVAATFLLMISLGATQAAEAAAIGVAWDPVPNATVTHYILHYGTSSNNYTATVQTGLATQWFVIGMPSSTRLYFAVQACNAYGCSGLSSEVNGMPFVPVPTVSNDFSGDSVSEVTIFRPASGMWYTRLNDGSLFQINWGANGDIPVPGDYDGDGRGDHAVWRPSTGNWHLRLSGGGTDTTSWGGGWLNDVPVPADYDGDGRTDIAVWRPATGTWYVKRSSTSALWSMIWGGGEYNDVPSRRRDRARRARP
jgi:hypothetical protein